jgi:hypothetical protein
MFAPVDVATTAAAMGLQVPAAAVAAAEAVDAGSSSSWLGGGDPNSSSRSSRGAGWVSSADVLGPSLRRWSEQTEQLGLVPEVKAVWWGLGDVEQVWGCVEGCSRAAYQQYRWDVDRLLEGRVCSQLQDWYKEQQFTTPVVIGA